MRHRLIAAALLLGAAGCSNEPEQNAAAPSAPSFTQHVERQMAFLNGLTPAQGWQSHPSGLKYRRVGGSGSGPKPKSADTVTMNYAGTLIDGTPFDSAQNSTMPLPNLIAGWKIGVPLMSVGDRFEFAVPPTLGYGPNDMGPIPGGSALLFTIELLDIKPS